MPSKNPSLCCPQKLSAQVVALADKRLEETSAESMSGHRKRDFNQWVHRELKLFCFEDVYAKATGCESGACLSCIHEVIFSQSALHVLTSCSANPYWFWRIVKATAEKAKTVPIGLELVEQAVQDIVAIEGARLVELTGRVFTNKSGAFDIGILRTSYTTRRLLRYSKQREAALSLGILISVPSNDPTKTKTKTKLNPLFA
jgi:hypothetical protein